MLVGVAAQLGWLPVGVAASERAIELNGTQVPFNLRAFRIGRLWVHDRAAIERATGARDAAADPEAPRGLAAIVRHRGALLTSYQDTRYARRYHALVERTRLAEQRVAPGSERLAEAVAVYFAKLMAYKDEYEVARLYSAPEFLVELAGQFEGDLKLSFNLAPPILSRKDPVTGHHQKREFGGWVLTAMRMLARLKGLRGTPFDLFGYTRERRTERALIDEYEHTIDRLLERLDARLLDVAVQIAELPEHIRGFGHVKEKHLEKVRARRSELLQAVAGHAAPAAKAA
jgi:indolepyruvate ferredoxin oxidoreductase